MEAGDSGDELKSSDPKQQKLEQDLNLSPEQLAALQKRYFGKCNLWRLGLAFGGTVIGGQLHRLRIIPNSPGKQPFSFRPFGVSRFSASMTLAFAALMFSDYAVDSCKHFRYYVIQIPELQRRRTIEKQEELLRGYQQRRESKMDDDAWR